MIRGLFQLHLSLVSRVLGFPCDARWDEREGTLPDGFRGHQRDGTDLESRFYP
ncbi:hypothetical protein SAMN05444342_3254 [Haladaptatus paucihalophilus DX253]|uniref:Uncharacterized protein n=1 Tax=Haladaptatus paucihalophilus DX253 TaxID=797209 RepID=A0A1M6YQA6_HALPU|nr:hypothetical protein SAMN05444342_3254 [Haladaptatus paucihalophilus DX253]